MNDFTTVFPISNVDAQTVAIKDSIDIAGTPTQLGSDACCDAPAAKKDATVVERLKQHHFSIVGKTVMHELAFGMTGVNRSYGTPVNPLYPNLIPGGSSSGSATAVASGQVAVAIGTDTGGSVRMPAACCGIYGFKPTFGLVSRAGVWPSASSLDCVGVFAAKPELITSTMQAIAPELAPLSTADAALLAQDTLTLGWLSVGADTRITTTLKAALTLDVSETTTTATACPRITLKPVECAGLDAAFQAGLSIINRETWLACKDFYATGKLGDDVATRLEKASHTTDSELIEAEYVRTIFSAQIDALLADIRVLALPTLPNAPMTLADALAGKTDVTASKLVRPFNLSGHPAYALPCHSDFDFPISLQLVGRKGDDAFVCALAERLAALLSPHLTTAAR